MSNIARKSDWIVYFASRKPKLYVRCGFCISQDKVKSDDLYFYSIRYNCTCTYFCKKIRPFWVVAYTVDEFTGLPLSSISCSESIWGIYRLICKWLRWAYIIILDLVSPERAASSILAMISALHLYFKIFVGHATILSINYRVQFNRS